MAEFMKIVPWGMREFAIIDLNGNLVWFVEPVAQLDYNIGLFR